MENLFRKVKDRLSEAAIEFETVGELCEKLEYELKADLVPEWGASLVIKKIWLKRNSREQQGYGLSYFLSLGGDR